MPEIYLFKIPKATAEMDDRGGVKIRVCYPSNPVVEKRDAFPADPAYGVHVLKELLAKGRADITDPEHPMRPPSAGVLDVMPYGHIASHRRDGGTKVNPYRLGVASGFPASMEDACNPRQVQQREGGEEHQFVTDTQNLVVPNDPIGRAASLQRADQLRLPGVGHYFEAKVTYPDGPDTIEICDEGGKVMASYKGHALLAWDQEINCTFYGVRQWEFDSNLYPIDSEGMEKSGKFIHFNREMFIFDPEDVKSMKYGDKIVDPRVYVLGEDRKPKRQKEEDAPKPYLFEPDDGLTRMLVGTGLWKGHWIEAQIAREERQLRSKGEK